MSGSVDVSKCIGWIKVAKAFGPQWKSERHGFSKRLGSMVIRFSYRSSNSIMGRFGGGWNWKLGFQCGGSTVLVSLLIVEIIISKYRGGA